MSRSDSAWGSGPRAFERAPSASGRHRGALSVWRLARRASSAALSAAWRAKVSPWARSSASGGAVQVQREQHAADEGADQRERQRRQQGGHGGPPPRPLYRPLAGADAAGADRLADQPAAQVVGQRLRRGVTPRRLLLQAVQADRFQVAVDRAVQACAAWAAPSPSLARACPAASRRGTAAGPSAARTGSRRGCRRPPPL